MARSWGLRRRGPMAATGFGRGSTGLPDPPPQLPLPRRTPDAWTGDMADPRSILLVEDEGPNRALARAVLARSMDPRVAGIVLLEAPNLARAREILDSQHVDLVLLDVRLPDGDGLALAAELHERHAG